MTPYYQDSAVILYHGDCREILPLVPPVDMVLTDPPWVMKTEVMQGCTRAIALWNEVCPLFRADRILVWLPIHSDPREWLNPIAHRPYLRQIYIRRAIPGYYGRSLLDGEIVHALGSWPRARRGRMVVPGGLAVTYIAADRENGHPGPRSEI